MNQAIRFLSVFLVTSLAVPLSMPDRTSAQTAARGNERFMMRQNMAIDNRFQYLELKIDRQQKEQWSRELFMTNISH